MTQIVKAVEDTAKDVIKPNQSNPLLQFGAGGLGSLFGIWAFAKIYIFLFNRYPNLALNNYAKPIAKTLTALGLYAIGNIKQIKAVPLLRAFFFGTGIGIFGSMVSEFVVQKTSGMTSTETSTESGALADTEADDTTPMVFA